MRPLRLYALLALTAASLPAHASHFFWTGNIDSQTRRANLRDCLEDGEFTFTWTLVAGSVLAGHTYDWQIRTTTATGAQCDMGSSSDNCVARTEITGWQFQNQFIETYKIRSFFTTEGGDTACRGEGTRKAYFCFRDNQAQFPGGTVEAPQCFANADLLGNKGSEFDYDFEPPAVPPAPVIAPGDNGLRVQFPPQDGGQPRYRAWWSSARTRLSGTPTCNQDYRTGCVKGEVGQTRIAGLTNGERVYVAISAIDDFDNESEVSAAAEGIPTPISDYFEHYVSSGGQERGGHCFIATAAYGSPWHPLVESLRRFRDRYLRTTAFGRDLVSFYESWSPALAEVVADTPFLKAVFQVALFPVAVAAWFVVDTSWLGKLLLLALLYALARLLRAASGRWRRRAAVASAAVVLLSFLGTARADESPRSFYLELKLGGIRPDLDGRDSLQGRTPARDIFGPGRTLVGGFELEYQLYKENGSFGVSLGALFFQLVGRGLYADGSPSKTETTILNAIPVQVSAVYRFDQIMRRYNVPLIPYAKLGLDYYFWWATNGAGDISNAPDGSGTIRRGAGGTIGLHGTVGLQVAVDAIDPRARKSLDEDTGINHSYFFAEMVFSQVSDFNQRSINFSAIYFLAGIALEF